MTRGDRIADKVSEIAGSWGFILGFSSFLLFWIVLNVFILKGDKQIDAYPFILLNLLLSCIAALQAPIIMMSQNRQAAKDSLRNQNDNQAELPDTASSRDILLIITGIVITTSGFYFIYKNKQCNNI